jgi:type I restriction enzyme S subunit
MKMHEQVLAGDSRLLSGGPPPTHWTELPLKRVATINRSLLPENTDPDFSFLYLDIGSVGTGFLAATPQTMKFRDAPSRARRLLCHGDVIVSAVGTYLKAVYQIPKLSTEPLVCSTGFAALRPLPSMNGRFLFYACQSEPFTNRVSAESIGIAYPAIAESRFAALSIPVPPLEEQDAIVRYLDYMDRRIRRYIAAKQRLIKLLEEQKQVIIQQAVIRGLDPNVRLKPSGVEWLGDIPKHWEVKPAKWFYREVDERSEAGDEELLSVSHITGVTPRPKRL